MTSYTLEINEKDNTIASKDSVIASLSSQMTSKDTQIATLQAPQLNEVNVKWDFNESTLGHHHVHVYGAVFNSGIDTAGDVSIDVWLYDSNNVLIKSFTIDLGDIEGKGYANIDTNIDYIGHCQTYNYQYARA